MQPHNQTSLKESESEDIEISLFNSCKASNSTAITCDALLNLIRSGEGFKEVIEQLRTTKVTADRDTLKHSLPAVTISGLFSKARKKEYLLSYSGNLQIDLDNVKNVLQVKEKLSKDKYCFAVFLSPSGNGLKVIFRIDNNIESHLKSFLAVEKYFLTNYGLTIDKTCKDVTRLMFLSHDKNLFVNKNAVDFSVNDIEEKEFEAVLNNLNKKETFNTGNRNSFVFKLACKCSEKRIPKELALKKIVEKFSENDFAEKEIINTVNSAYSYPQNNSKNNTSKKSEKKRKKI